MGKQQKAWSTFGTVKRAGKNSLEEVAVHKELIVALANSNVKAMLNVWITNIKKADVESMSDGHDNMTAYGFNDVFDEPAMGLGSRPTLPSIELLDRVCW
ncbi:hypothetical protein NC652_004882 [Populus alba x Populus x berolinensis]|nr:hypothetical protein NC652_004882 [Populus alba x Populus x berolinensis]